MGAKKTKSRVKNEKREEKLNLIEGMSPAERRKFAMESINKRFGAGSIQLLSSQEEIVVERRTSGSLILDLAMSKHLPGGYPMGRMIEIISEESMGKTTLALTHIAANQRINPDFNAMYDDMEHALDPEYASDILKVDLDRMPIAQPDSGEEAIDIARESVKAYQAVIIDSVAALAPQAELDGTMSDNGMGLQARLMSKACRDLNSDLVKDCILIWINQWRNKIGAMMGDPRVPAGGNALKFYASIRLTLNSGEKIKEGDKVIGKWIIGEVKKNKTAPPFRKFEIPFYFDRGIDNNEELVILGLQFGVLEKSGHGAAYKGKRLGAGIQSSAAALAVDEELFREIFEKLCEATQATKIAYTETDQDA
jgi:recombination protein RecA